MVCEIKIYLEINLQCKKNMHVLQHLTVEICGAFSLLWPASVQSLGKIKFRNLEILKSVGPQILSLETVDYSGTSEHY